jgi:hypothetical protein
MMRRVLRCGVGFLAVMTTACGPDYLTKRIATPERDARAQHVIHLVVAGQRDSLRARERFEGDSATIARGFVQLDSVLGGRRVDSLALVGANQFSNGTIDRITLSYEFRTESGWRLASVTTLDSASNWVLLGFHAEPLPGELRAVNDFHLTRGSAAQYLALIATVASAIITLGTAIFLAMRRNFPKRWRWVLLSLVGVGMVSVNWTTGELATRLISVQLFGGSFVRAGEFAPWILSFAFPIGAIVALSRYRSYLDSLKTPKTPEALEQSASQQTVT